MKNLFRRLGILLATIGVIACSNARSSFRTGGGPVSAMSHELALAVEHEDRIKIIELASLVLTDELERTYLYGYEERRFVQDAIEDFRLVEISHLLRKVASMSYERHLANEHLDRDSASFRELLDFTAITGALVNLTHLKDSQAVPLNLKHLRTPSVRSAAVMNLQYSQAWETTDEIRSMAWSLAPTSETISDFWVVLRFLYASPQATKDDCAMAGRLKSSFSTCFDPSREVPGFAGCHELALALRQLQARLACDAPSPLVDIDNGLISGPL
jgi:hypothetical protein